MMVRLIGLALPPDGQAALTATGWQEPLRGIPLTASYDVPPTRHNGEVWAFAPADAGQIWVGSDELFLFNGESREKIELPFETYAVRALAHDASGKLWIGAIGEIGHLERTPTGGWRYVSARDDLRAAGIDNVRVWEALATPQGMVFVADDQILRWNGTRFERWPIPSATLLRPTRDRDTLWIVEPNVGVFRMEADGPRQVLGAAELPNSTVNWAIGSAPVSVASRGEPLMVGGQEGIYRRRDNGWEKLEQLSAAIVGKSAWRVTLIDKSTVAIGTVLGGMVVGATDDRVLAILDRASGLPNESITSLWHDDRSGQLWIGYVGGMSRVDARGSTSVFDTRNGLRDAPVLKTVLHGDRTYVLARRALSVLSPASNGRAATARQLSQLPTPLSDALSSGPNLWLSGLGGGIWRVVGDTVSQETPPSGFVYALAEAQAPPYELFYLENTHVRMLVPTADGGWEPGDLHTEVGGPAVSALRDGSGDLWISTVTRGIFRYRVKNKNTSSGLQLQLARHYSAGNGLPLKGMMRTVLTTLGDCVFSFSEQGILAHDSQRDAFVALPGLERFVALAGARSDDPAVAYWVVRNTDIDLSQAGTAALIRLRTTGSDTLPTWEPIDATGMEHTGRISGLSFTGGDAPALWVAGSQALVRLSTDTLSAPPALPSLELRGIMRNSVPQPLPAAGAPLQLDADTTRLRIELAGVKRTEVRSLLVQASLEGVSNEWSQPQSDSVFEFTGLSSGKYTFNARAVDRFGRVGPTLAFAFVLAPPWYAGARAIVAYVLAGVLAIGAGVRWRLRHLHRLAERLNRLVDERTAELARANAARNEFLEAISHEIRNPLNGITNLVDLLHDAKLNPEAQKLANSLGRSAAHLKQVFGDVLGFTKLEYGHVGIEQVTFSLKQLLDDTLALFVVQARNQQNELRLTLPPDFTDGFSGDAEKISAVLRNYVSNALKYAPAGVIEVIVRVRSDGTQQNICNIWLGVRDQGPGISAAEQKNLFKKFTRGREAKARGISGTGLGLAICRGIAELLDGKVGVISEEGRGATFWLEVPLTRAPLPAAPPATASQPAIRTSATDASTQPAETVALIVDDQEYNQAVLRGIAQRLGYQTEVASCADEVWPLVDRTWFDVVFMDWELPGLSGGDIARRLRDHRHARDAVIIATTAHDTDDIVQKCLEAGMDGFAAKPFDTAQMREIVREAMARRAGRKNQPAAPRPSPHPGPIATAPAQLTLTAFADFAADDPARAQQAVTLYLDTLDQEMGALRAAIDTKDRDAIARRAHRLRSHAGLVNGVALNAAAQKLVLAARNDSPDAWQACTRAVFDEAASLKSAIVRLAAETPRATQTP